MTAVRGTAAGPDRRYGAGCDPWCTGGPFQSQWSTQDESHGRDRRLSARPIRYSVGYFWGSERRQCLGGVYTVDRWLRVVIICSHRASSALRNVLINVDIDIICFVAAHNDKYGLGQTD